MENFEYIFFDFDGTIMNTSEGVFEGFDRVREYFNIELEDKSVYNTMIGPPLYESFDRVFHLTGKELEKGIEVFHDYYTPIGLYKCKLYDEVAPLIKKLKAAGKKIYVATSKPEVYARQLLQKFGIDSLFDFIGGVDMEGVRRDKIDVIRYVMDTNNLNDVKDQCLMLGDTHYDIDGAKLAGLKSMGILWGFGSEKSLRESGADYIAKDATHVYEILTGK